MEQIFGLIVVAVIAVFNFYIAIPAGFGFDLPDGSIAVAAFVGSVSGTVAMVFVGDRIMPRLRAAYRRVRPGDDEEEASQDESAAGGGRARALVDRWGAPGLGIIGPLTIGGFASAISGVAMGIPKLKLAVWVAIGQGIVIVGFVFLVDTAAG